MALIKRYSSRKVIIELRKYKDGYHLLVREWDPETGEFELEHAHKKIKGLDRASNLMLEELLDAEARGHMNFKIYSRH